MANAIIASLDSGFVNPIEMLKGSDWHFLFIEMHDLRLCSEDVLQEAFDTAPTAEARAYIFGAREMRNAFSVLFNRSFGMCSKFS